MTKEQVAEKALQGVPVVVAEYRAGKTDKITYRASKGPQAGSMVTRDTVKHSIEMGDVQVMVTEWLPDGKKPEDVVIPYKKGQRVVVTLETLEPDKGFFRAGGKIEALEETPAKGK